MWWRGSVLSYFPTRMGITSDRDIDVNWLRSRCLPVPGTYLYHHYHTTTNCQPLPLACASFDSFHLILIYLLSLISRTLILGVLFDIIRKFWRHKYLCTVWYWIWHTVMYKQKCIYREFWYKYQWLLTGRWFSWLSRSPKKIKENKFDIQDSRVAVFRKKPLFPLSTRGAGSYRSSKFGSFQSSRVPFRSFQ